MRESLRTFSATNRYAQASFRGWRCRRQSASLPASVWSIDATSKPGLSPVQQPPLKFTIQAPFSVGLRVMKLSLLRRPISHLPYRPPEIQRRRCSSLADLSVSNEVLAILDSAETVEPALEPLVPFLSAQLVSSIIKEESNPYLGFRFFIWAVQRKRLRSFYSSKLVIEMLEQENGFYLYWRALDEVKNSGAPIVAHVFTVLMSGYMKMGLPEKAVESFGKMKDFECEPDVYTFNAILRVLMRKRLLILALAVYNRMCKAECLPNRVTFSILINGLFKNGETAEALQMFDEMTQWGIKPNRYTYAIIISGLCEAGYVDRAHTHFNKMKESGCSKDFVAYNALLDGFCKSARMDEALALLGSFMKDGFVPTLRAYSSLVDGFFRVKRYDEVYRLYKDITEVEVKGKVELDVVFYTIVMKGLSKAGKVDDAMNLLLEMTGRGVMPDTYCYNALIEGLCDAGFLDRAQSLQLEISARDCSPDAHTYTILICAMCRNGLVEDADQIFKEMERVGCFPTVVTFNALIHGLYQAGKLEEAKYLYCKMQIGINPSVFIRLSRGPSRDLDSTNLTTMLQRLCESGHILKAYRILMQLENLPDLVTCNILIHRFCESRNIDSALELFRDMQEKGLSPDPITYGTLVNGLMRERREKEACGMFDQMVKSGIKPSPEVYRCLITWLCRRKKVLSAFSHWLKYLKSSSVWEDKVLQQIEEHFKKGEVEKAMQCLAEWDIKLNNFSLAPYTIFLIGFCQMGNPQEAVKIFFILKELKVIVTPPSCVKLIHSLCKRGNLAVAAEIFLYTLENGYKLMPRVCNYLLKSLLLAKGQWIGDVLDIVSEMESRGYDLNSYIYPSTKSLIRRHQNMWQWHMAKRAPG